MQFSLDYPSVNCKQCLKNLKEDEIEPDCKECEVDTWDIETRSIMVGYNRACIWGDLNHDSIKQALIDLEIPVFKHRLYRRCLIAMHELINRDAQEKQCQQPMPE